jgi:regulatory protein YycH of two-component signal transduction system YycFG
MTNVHTSSTFSHAETTALTPSKERLWQKLFALSNTALQLIYTYDLPRDISQPLVKVIEDVRRSFSSDGGEDLIRDSIEAVKTAKYYG